MEYDRFTKEEKWIDYLQIVRLKEQGNLVQIEHEQEIPPHEDQYEFKKAEFSIEHDIRIYVIDSVYYSTKIFVEEY